MIWSDAITQPGTVNGTAVAVIGGIATLIIQQFFGNRAARDRAIEHRAQTLADIELAKAEAGRHAAELALLVANNSHTVNAAIAENTALTQRTLERADDAYKEANTVNQKIQSIGLKMKDDLPLAPE